MSRLRHPAVPSALLNALLAATLLATAAPLAAAPLAAAPLAAAPAADGFILVPEGGRLDALDDEGRLVGPCPLRHTDVDAKVSGHFTRVDVAQRYHNPYDHKIEAVYTFPLSHRGAVDRMRMTVGDRVVEGEVKRRDQARRIYEAARGQGHVASLLEQERPNIFTQSVANIEPGAEVLIEISYVEVLESADGEHRFDFPMVVAPRYTPGRPSPGEDLPDDAEPRDGVILGGPAEIEGAPGLSDAWLRQHATAIRTDSPILHRERRAERQPAFTFAATYADGLVEEGAIFDDGVGHVGGRWFICSPRELPKPGEPFAVDTDQVPDASRVTPMPVRPDERAGHDIAVRLTIDTGGPGIAELSSNSHDITREDEPAEREDPGAPGPHRTTVKLEAGRDIPNRDFRLAWRLSSDEIEEATLTHTGDYGDFSGGFFTLILQPPGRIPDDQVRPRELIFVLDQSGSMSGQRLADRSALDAAKDVITQAIDTMREGDRFNIISFSGGNDALWDRPRPNTAENRRRAQDYVNQRRGGGGTEMRPAVLRALRADAAQPDVAQPPPAVPDEDGQADADDRMRIVLFVTDGLVSNDPAIIQAIREHAHETRVFTIGMSHAPNRHLLDEMARVGRGDVDYVLPEDDVEPTVERFARRIATPVLTDIELAFEGEATVTDILPSPEHMGDLFDVQPLVIHGRYADPGPTTLTIRGRTGRGAYERAIDLDLPEARAEHDVIATLWARERVAERMRERDDDAIVALGESFGIVTQHTSFVAVERQRVTIGGEPTLVRVPIEFPKGMSWAGIFGGADDADVAEARLDFFRAPADEQAEAEVRMQRRADPAAAPQPQFELGQQTRGRGQQGQFGGAMGGYAGGVGGGGQGLFGGAGRGPGAPGGGYGGAMSGSHSAHPAASVPRQGAHREALAEQRLLAEEEIGRELRAEAADPAHPRDGGFIEGGTFRLVTHVADLPDGTTIVRIALLGADQHDAADRLRDLLESEGEAEGAGAEPLGRIVPDPRTDNLHLIAPAPLADAITPFAEKLADPELSDDARRATLDELIETLRRKLPEVRRDHELRRVLEDSLYEHVLALRDPANRPAAADPIRVTVLLHDLEPNTLAALRAAGFTPEATADAGSFTVGHLDAAKLEALALLTPVRRIEPLR